jgi:hypothetical protein
LVKVKRWINKTEKEVLAKIKWEAKALNGL